MKRRPTTQDLTWLLDLDQNKQLDIDPPYQRRSVWTLKDRQFFLDTIFRDYPSPAIFLHKTIDEGGKSTYHVVDGKQRIQTILDFVNDQIKIAKNFGDIRLNGKRWIDLKGEQDLKQKLWNYQITVEMIDDVEGSVINEVFDRLNRNARRLTPQELRHARFEGWLISEVEAESTRDEWSTLGIVTKARAKRMIDSQFISELMLVILEGQVLGFDQDSLDDLYGKYDDPSETVPELDQDEFLQRFAAAKNYLIEMDGEARSVASYAKGFGHFYTLWAFVALTKELPTAPTIADRYMGFIQKVQTLAEQADLEAFLRDAEAGKYTIPLTYLTNSRGASTDLGPRTQRLDALKAALLD